MRPKHAIDLTKTNLIDRPVGSERGVREKSDASYVLTALNDETTRMTVSLISRLWSTVQDSAWHFIPCLVYLSI